MLQMNIFDIEALQDGFIDRREDNRADMLTSVFHGVLYGVSSAFSGKPPKSLPYLRLRPETTDEIEARLKSEWSEVAKEL